jgi:protein transport protein YIF1
MNDPTAQMGFQVGQTALKHGQEYVEQNVCIPLKQVHYSGS